MRPQLCAFFQIGDLLPADGRHQIGSKLILQDVVLPLPIVSIPHSGTSVSSEFWEIQTGEADRGIGSGDNKKSSGLCGKAQNPLHPM